MKKRTVVLLLIMLLVIAMAALFHSHNRYLLLQGEVDAPEVLVASKAKGRIVERHVERGDDVKAGQVLLTLDSPELVAKYESLKAARNQSQAKLNESLSGTRAEQMRNLHAQLSQTQAQYTNALNEYNRIVNLAKKGYVAANELDNARKSRDVAAEQVRSAQAQLDQGKNGDRIEQREQYAAGLSQAEQNLLEMKVQLDDLQVKAPVDGEVGTIPAEVGELFNANSPLITLIRLPQAYFVYNLREDLMHQVKKGDKVKISVPALGGKEVDAAIRFISPMGDFATKRATRATGDFDLKTFEVRIYPLEKIDGLRPGMSALWRWND